MENKPQFAQNEATGELVMKLIAFVGGALMGAFIGGVFLWQFAAAFFGKVDHIRLYTTLAVALIFGLSSYRKAAKQMRRQRRTGEVAEQLGLTSSSDEEDNLEEALSYLFGEEGRFSVSNVFRKEIGDAEVAVAELTRWRSSGSSSNRSSSSTTRTIAYFESPDLFWPTFTLQPEGVALNLLSKMTGIDDIDFDTHPKFSDSYHLTGTRPDLVRIFFTPELLQYFSEHPGLELHANDSRLVLVQSGGVVAPEQLESFLEHATDVFMQVVKASVQTKSALDAAMDNEPSPTESIEAMPGIVGAMIRRMMVTPQELHAFLSSQPPRSIPANIKRRRYGSGSLMAAVIGFAFFTVGTLFATVSILDSDKPWNEERIVMLALGSVFATVGFCMCFFTTRYRLINSRMLKHGIAVEANVLSVEKTDVSINNQQQYRLRVRFNTQMGTQESKCNIYGRRARDAMKLADQGKATRILYDPSNPRRILWAESLLFDHTG